MLSAADASLVQRDAAIAGLRLLLDEEACMELLQRAYPAAEIAGAQLRYVRYKPSVSFLGSYCVRAGDVELPVYARAHNPADRGKVEKPAQRRGATSELGAGVQALPDLGIVLHPFPNDYDLQSLLMLAHEQKRAKLLRRLLPEHPHLWNASFNTLRYKPERRYVARLVDAEGPDGAVVKFHSPDDFYSVTSKADAFSSEPPLRVPRRLRRSQRYGVTAYEWLDGWELTPAVFSCSEEILHRVGEALLRLHRQRPKRLKEQRTLEGVRAQLDSNVQSLGAVLPQFHRLGQRLAGELLDRLSTVTPNVQAIHGDFAADQVLVRDHEIGIIDLDRTVLGDPRFDLGSFGARLLLQARRCGRETGDALRALATLVDGYTAASGEEIRHLETFVGVELLRLVTEPFRHRDPEWADRAAAILEESEVRLREGL